MYTLRELRQSTGRTVQRLWLEVQRDGGEVSTDTIYKAEKGIPITRVKANTIINTLNRLTGGNYTRESFPALQIIEELGEKAEEETDRAIA